MNKFFTATATVFALFSVNAYADHVVKTFKADQIKRLKLKNNSGDSLIVGRDLSEVKVTVDRIKWNNTCKLDIDETSGTLLVKIRQGSSGFSFFSKSECLANIHVTLPLEADVELKSGSGDISAENLKGEFDVNVGSGDVNIEKSQIRKLLARSGSGDLKVSGEIVDADIRLGSGDVKLICQKVPLSGDLTIRSGSGDATVLLPHTSKIKVAFTAGSGKLSNELGHSQNAEYRISMRAGSGNLNIRKL